MADLVDVATHRRFALGDQTTIGRDPASSVHLADGMVSLSHARIVRTESGRFKLVDLGSRHGTWKGDRRISEAELDPGDEIMLGAVRLRFEDEGQPGDRELAGLRAVAELTRAIGVEHDVDRILEHVLRVSFKLCPADRGAIVLYEPDGGRPGRRVTLRRDGSPADDIVLSTGAVSEVVQRRTGIIASEADPSPTMSRSESLFGQGLRSTMYVPMLYRDEMLGVLHLGSLAAESVFRPADIEVLGAIASQAALSIKNAQLVQRVQSVIVEEGERLERVVRDLPCGLLLLDASRRIILRNAWAAERPDIFNNGARVGDVLEWIGSLATEELLQAGGEHVDTAAGTPRRLYSVSAQPARDADETVIVIRDVTEQRERDAQTARNERLAVLGQLAGGIAHDFNNLLVVILSHAAFAAAAVADAETREDIGQISTAAQRAAELTRQLLAFGRREVVTPKVVDLGVVVAGMGHMLSRTLGEQVRLENRIAADVPPVFVDQGKLEQVIMNLVVNGRDAMPDGGEIVVSTSTAVLDDDAARRVSLRPGRYAVLSVRDSGHGMTPEIAARVFEPFFTTKEHGKGTGLGLASAYGIVNQAGGNITVESVPARGSEFRVYLPETQAELLAVDPTPLARPRGGTETILLTEDEDAVRRLTKRILTSAGYTVLEAASGREALAIAAKQGDGIRLLLTDLVMPGMSGRELARQLTAARPNLGVVFMSGYFADSIGGDTKFFVPKPFTSADLLRCVRAAIDGVKAIA